MPAWKDVPDEVKKRFRAPPDPQKFADTEEYEEAVGYWQGSVGRSLGFAMQHYAAGERKRIQEASVPVVAPTLMRASVTVEWGYKCHTLSLTARNWKRVKSGKPLSIRGKGYVYDCEFFWDYWDFGGGIDGSLIVNYGNDGVCGFEGVLGNAEIEEHV